MGGKAEWFETTPHGDEMHDLVLHISITVTFRVTMEAILVQVTYLDSGPLDRGAIIHFFRTAHLEIKISLVGRSNTAIQVLVHNWIPVLPLYCNGTINIT